MTTGEHGLQAPAGSAVSEPAAADTAEFRLRAALAELDQLAVRPLAEHAPVYETLHDDLQAVLGEIDSA